MKINRMFKTTKEGKIKAFFDIEFLIGTEKLIIKGFTIISGDKGLFVGCPSTKSKDGKYYDNIIMTKDLKSELNQIALKEFQAGK